MKKVKEEAFKHSPKIEPWKKVIMGLPLLFSVSWIFFLQYNKVTGTELLSPAESAPLMIALIIFTIGYVIFLFLMFSENIKEFFEKKAKH